MQRLLLPASRASVALKVLHRPPPLASPTKLSVLHGPQNEITCAADSCRTAADRNKWVCTEFASLLSRQQRPPRQTAASLTADCPDTGTAASSEHRGRQVIKSDDRLEEACGCRPHSARQRRAPCTASLATCYETPDVTWIETHDAARARGGLRSSHDGQPTVLYCVPTNPGPRSFHAWPVRRCRCASSSTHSLTAPNLAP